jgi:predicted DNA-binding transcriptional regulator AlpA
MSQSIRPELLTAAEVARLFGMSRATFREWVKTQPGFPKAVILGKTKANKVIKKWRRRQVMSFIELLEQEK